MCKPTTYHLFFLYRSTYGFARACAKQGRARTNAGIFLSNLLLKNWNQCLLDVSINKCFFCHSALQICLLAARPGAVSAAQQQLFVYEVEGDTTSTFSLADEATPRKAVYCAWDTESPMLLVCEVRRVGGSRRSIDGGCGAAQQQGTRDAAAPVGFEVEVAILFAAGREGLLLQEYQQLPACQVSSCLMFGRVVKLRATQLQKSSVRQPQCHVNFPCTLSKQLWVLARMTLPLRVVAALCRLSRPRLVVRQKPCSSPATHLQGCLGMSAPHLLGFNPSTPHFLTCKVPMRSFVGEPACN